MSNISLKNNNIELNSILETVNSLSSGKEEQEKSIEITENGITEILPDDGKLLSKVNITTNIESSAGNDNEYYLKFINRSFIEFNDNTLTNIGDYVLAGCPSLTSVNLPICTTVGVSAFCNCSSLTSVNLPKCNNVGSYAFYQCTSLTSIDLPECTGARTYAFGWCSTLSSINLPVCTSFDTYVFMSCKSLSSIDLPMCQRIGFGVFSKCTSLTTLTLRYSSVVALSNINAFTSTPMSISTLTGTFGSIYVPASLVNAYKSATNWVTYADRITAIVE